MDETELPGTGEAPEVEAPQKETPASQPDFSRDFESLKQSLQEERSQRQRLLEDLNAHKEELSQKREDDRRKMMMMVGDKETIQEVEEKRRQERIKDEFFKIMPEAKRLFENQGNQNEPSLSEKAFFNTARQKGFDLAKQSGFTSNEGQQLMPIVADILIQNTPQWKDRFYKNGDMSVIDEVSKFLDDKVFGPRDRAVEARTIARIQKQGRYATPLPSKRGGSGVPEPTKKYDTNKAEDRKRLYGDIYNRTIAGE